MSPIVEYLDYRKYILDYYTECKATSGFTWRAFAAKAGFSSPIYLKQVTEGKCNLSSAAAERVGKAMELAGLDLTYFRQLVAFNHAKVDAERIHAFKIMQNIAKSSKAKFLGGDDFAYFQSWKAPVIREISEAMPGASAEEMAKECLPHITPGEVNNTMQLLLRLGLLVQDKDGRFHQTSNVISMADGELKKNCSLENAAGNGRVCFGRPAKFAARRTQHVGPYHENFQRHLQRTRQGNCELQKKGHCDCECRQGRRSSV